MADAGVARARPADRVRAVAAATRNRLFGAAGAGVLAVCCGCAAATGHAPLDRTPAVGPTMGSTSPPPAVSHLVRSASWQRTAAGYRLELRPTGYGRRHVAGLRPQQLAAMLRAAGPPPLRLTATTQASLVDQLRCHAAFAPTKPLWDLESWRPDVGYLATVAHECNPS